MSRRSASLEGRRSVPPNPDKPRIRRRMQDKPNVAEEQPVLPPQFLLSTEEQPLAAARKSGPGSEHVARSGPDRRRLHGELIEMRERYRDAATEACSNLERFEELCGKVKTLLDEEFPGWEAGPESRRSDMVTLYFQYRADAYRAAGIQEKFEQLTRDIDMLMTEEFPDWQPPSASDG